MLSPHMSTLLSNQNFLSPDGVCYSFDHRANGYGRGEGIVAIIVKRLDAAIRDNDMIRAVIRATGTNQDGHTPGFSQPSSESQERLIREVYAKAGLGFEFTRYFEAHGRIFIVLFWLDAIGLLSGVNDAFRNRNSDWRSN